MKNVICVISLLMIIVLLCGCTPVQSTYENADTDLSESTINNETNDDVYVGPWEKETFIHSNSIRADWGYAMLEKTTLNVYDTRTGEQFHLCPDPLCNHINECPLYPFRYGMDFVVSPNESKEGPVIYFETQDPGAEFRRGHEWGGYYMCRYDYASQSMKVLAGPYKPTGTTWAFNVQTNTIYHTVFESDEHGTTYIEAYELDGNTAQWTHLCTLPTQAVPSYIDGDVLYFDTITTAIYRLHMGDPEKQVEELEQKGKVYAGYIYYMDYTNADKIRIPLPDELQEYALYDASFGYGEDHAADLYRIALDIPNAKPELMMEDISVRYNIKHGGGYICVAECEPRLAVAALTAGGRYYDVDDPAAPENAKLITLFQYSRTYHVFDVETLEERVISLDQVSLSAPKFNRNAKMLVSTYSYMEPAYVIDLNNHQSQYSTYGSIPFDFETFQNVTDEDFLLFGYEVK